MASNSKKRRRVLGVSCILAALIIASSSFAWFTSKDEVTNRLTAQADFGVKIVESFAPPKNMLPGQEVNKDVYATNTGSIPAFVKEEVSTVMTVTIEKNTPDLVPGKSVEIKDDERYAVEAGSYLAYKPNGSQKVLGETVVARPGDKTETEKLTFDPNNTVIPGTTNGQYTDFVPDVEGLYVFRRVVNVAANGTEDFKTTGDYNATDVTKTGADATVGYDAYYFVPGATAADNKYYKVSNLSVVPDNTPDKADDNVKTDGILLYASAGFVEEEEKVLDPMDLECVDYDAAGATAAGAPGAGKYLVASYDTGDSNYETKFKVAADLYDKAIHQFEYATALQQSAEAEAEAALGASGTGGAAGTGYQGAKDTYDDAVATLTQATTDLKTAKKNYEEKLIAKDNATEANEEAKRNYEQSMAKMYGVGKETTGAETAGNYVTGNGSLFGKYKASETAYNTASAGYNDFGNFLAELQAYNATFGANANADVNSASAMADLEDVPVSFFEGFQTWLAGQSVTAEKHDYYAATAQYLIDKKNYEEEKAKCFGTTGTAANPASGSYKYIYLDATNGTDKKLTDATDEFNTAKATYIGADGSAGTGTAVGDFNKAVEDYNAAYNDMMDKLGVKEEKDKQKTDADAIYTAANTELTRARDAYNAYVTADPALKDETNANNVLKMFIKLSDKVVCDDGATLATVTSNDQWQHHPHQLVNDVAEFYYTGMLEGGETSSKLIDSVTLSSKATTDMYKSFDFDINIAMKSVQVAYDENDNITATATPTELGAFAKINNGTATSDVDSIVVWQDTQP